MDNYIIIGLAILIPVISIVLGIEISRYLYHKNLKRLDQYFSDQNQKLKEISDKYKAEANQYTEELVKNKQQELETFEKQSLNKINSRLQQFERQELDKVNKHIRDVEALQLQVVTSNCNTKLVELENKYSLKEIELEAKYANKTEDLEDQFEKRKNEISTTLRSVQNKLMDAHLHKKALYEDMQRQQAVKEHEAFYSIQLSETALEDIDYLKTIKNKISTPMLLDKFIFDAYVSKPLLELSRRVLNSRKVSGVYKITSKKNGLVYIGQSTDIGTRWRNHILSACGLDGVADSIFQRALKKEGIENFTFELLEECKKEELHEKEKYWIEFFESNKYGLNMKV